MLLSLHIENVAVIRQADLDLSAGFTALTGETGAGKSLIIDSIGLLLGEKAERDLIRTGESTAMVSGLFGDLSARTTDALAALGISPDEEGTLLVQRTISVEGRSQIRINGRTVSLSVLKQIMPALIGIHGQSDTHTLTDAASHLPLLDVYAADDDLLASYRAEFSEYSEAQRQIRELVKEQHERERTCEMLAYQIRDIDAVAPHVGEEEELVDKKVKLKSSERIRKNTSFAFKALKGSEKGSAAFLLDRTATALTQISDVIPECTGYAERLRDALFQVEDIAEEVYAVFEEMEGDGDADINAIEERLDKISKLKRKYGLTVDEVLAFRENAAKKLETLENADDVMRELKKKRDDAYARAVAIADKLHEVRADAAHRLEESVKETLRFLDMPKVVFFASMKQEYEAGEKILNPDGVDSCEFYISANSGADPKPLSKIASGGELARIMLALKCALSDKEGVATLIFDEIDAGVSGKTARKIGIKMLSLSKCAQVLCVTHSAQIASLSDTHLLISKAEKNGATETSVRVLDEVGRTEEISRILGGISVTDAQRAAAVDMLTERRQYQS